MSCAVCGSTLQRSRAAVRHVHYVECQGCGVVYQTTLPDAVSLESLYNQCEGTYFTDKAKNANAVAGEEWIRQTARFFLEQLRLYYTDSLQGACVLDIGCGTGVLLDEFQRCGAVCTGVEMSTWASEYARNRFGLNILNADILSAELPLGHFDIVVMSHVIEHMANPNAILHRVALLLKERGMVMICTPDNQSLGARIFGAKWLYYLPDEHLHLFSMQSIRFALEYNNLSVCAVQRYLWRKRSVVGALMRLPLHLLVTALRGSVQYVTANDGLIALARKV
ncbi:MAG: class I SAM-dependent methyltransferase [Bacteroidota bacterium]|nr:class I SAM-dependent methyltransferase [Candidatus Kapabacteria bacterium]MDW8221105.1 class I SAM-dependent methyltransferase [Bacteroidota bacterium]